MDTGGYGVSVFEIWRLWVPLIKVNWSKQSADIVLLNDQYIHGNMFQIFDFSNAQHCNYSRGKKGARIYDFNHKTKLRIKLKENE